MYLGKGFGSEAIKLSTELFYRERPEAEEVVAEIFEENTASKKAFQKAGYIFSHKTLNQGKKIEVFKSGR